MRYVIAMMLALAAGCGGTECVAVPAGVADWYPPHGLQHYSPQAEVVWHRHLWEASVATVSEPGTDSTWTDLGCAN